MEMNNDIMDRQINNGTQGAQQEISFFVMIRRFWEKRRFIAKVVLGAILLGLFIALFTKEQFASKIIFVPQATSTNSSASSLAALAGINLNNATMDEGVSPLVYQYILENVDFMKELMYSEVKFEDWEKPISLIDYFTNPEYQKFNIIDCVVKYTVGLPWVILDLFREKEEEEGNRARKGNIGKYSYNEYQCVKIFQEILSLTLNEKEGSFELIAKMPEASASAQVADIVFRLLEKYVIALKIEKVQATLNYINDRFDEAEKELDEKQLAYAQFLDANKTLSLATSRIKDEQLKREYGLANTIFNELARQKIQVELKVKEDTPVLTIVKPAVIPRKRVKPHRSIIMILFTFLGVGAGCGSVLLLDDFKKKGYPWPKKWE